MKAEELHKRCLERDEQAWSYAYNYVLSYLRRTNGPDGDMRDLAHDTIRYFLDGALDRVRKPAAFKKLLRMKAGALLIDYKRYQGIRPEEPLETRHEGNPSGQNPGAEDALTEPETRLFLEKAVKILRQALRAIDKECGRLLEGYFRARFLGTGVKALASEMARPENTVRVMIHRCHKKLLEQPGYRALVEEYRAGG
jgi:RNA polymerase sigma factor (sigma-70 family)